MQGTLSIATVCANRAGGAVVGAERKFYIVVYVFHIILLGLKLTM